MSRFLAYVVGLGAVAIVLSPAASKEPKDSYPLSTYPMFSKKREDPWIYKFVGVSQANRVALPPSLVVGGPEVMQAASTISRSVNQGESAMQGLCREVAVRASQDPSWRHLTAVELVAVQYDPVAYFALGPKPLQEQMLTRCGVPRAQ
ncbi:MAG: hypothetical protein SFV15_14305 [Polyangiaceae bacterium]|nr:hypothetical protein [Polyangiaceae bacterium]